MDWYGCNHYARIKIGDGAIIAAKSVVTRDVAPYTIVGGNPANKIKERFTNTIIEELLQIQWWHFDIEKITENIDAIVQGYRAIKKAKNGIKMHNKEYHTSEFC